jgi:uncharacterized protein
MPLVLNIRQLEHGARRFEGELCVEELSLENLDELVRPAGPLSYAFWVDRHERGLLLEGQLELPLECECARCLSPFCRKQKVENWTCLLPLFGEEKAPINNDCVDLTPYLREDIVLSLPQRPLCQPDCAGLPSPAEASSPDQATSRPSWGKSSAWAKLDELEF